MDYLSSHFSPRNLPRGEGQTVLVIPGLGAGPWSTSRLRSTLAGAGFDVHDWGLGTNTGPKDDIDEWLAEIDVKLHQLFSANKQKVSLVGWSLGGIFARELAKRHPRMVKQVITLGTPWKDFETGTNASGLYRLVNRGASATTTTLRARLGKNPNVPLTAIYSRNDGIVSWQTCVLREELWAENVEVKNASHLGMCVNPAVIRLVADKLSRKKIAMGRN
jgi:pimeloyl-ACP methyl ester carboxylesterase